jgi:hypothetical protein
VQRKLFLIYGVLGVTIVGASFMAWTFFDRKASSSDVVETGGLSYPTKASNADESHETLGAPEKIASGQESEISFDLLKANAENGSAVAQRDLSEIYGLCMSYSLDPATQLATLDHMAKLKGGVTTGIEQVKNRLKARCGSVDGGQPIPKDAVDLWLQQAAKAGDPVANVRLRNMSQEPLSAEEVIQLSNLAADAHDPKLMLELSNLMSRPVSGDIPEKYARVSGNPVAGAAWAISACRAGAACGNGTITMDTVCINTGACNYPNYESFIMGELVPEGDRARLNRIISEIKAIK